MSKPKRTFQITIWGLPWTAVLVFKGHIPRKHWNSKATRNAFRDGFALGVSQTLTELDIKPDPDLYGDRS